MDERGLATLVGWLAGLTLMVWRSPGGGRLACVIGAAVWLALPLWEPSLRMVWHFGLTVAFLVGGLARRRQPGVEVGVERQTWECTQGEDHDPADSSVSAR